MKKYTKNKEQNIETAEKVVIIKTDIQNKFLFISFLIIFIKKLQIQVIIYPIFLFFSSFNLIIRLIFAKKSVVAPCIVIPNFPQAFALP